MAIEITPNLVGLWWLSTVPGQQDWLCGLTDAGDGTFILEFRFRYYSPVGDGNPFNEEDHKSWSAYKATTTRESALETVRMMAETLASSAGQKLYEILMVNGDVEAFYRAMKKVPCFHLVAAPREPENESKWRCRCGHLNELIMTACDACGTPLNHQGFPAPP